MASGVGAMVREVVAMVREAVAMVRKVVAMGREVQSSVARCLLRDFSVGWRLGGGFIPLHSVGWRSAVIVVAPDTIPDGGDNNKASEHHRSIVHALLGDRLKCRHAEQGNCKKTPA